MRALWRMRGAAPMTMPAPTGGGGGRTCVLRDGAVFEQAGIGFSDVSGTRLPPSATAARPELVGASWRAVGVSLVFHPRNPYCPDHARERAPFPRRARWRDRGLVVRRRLRPHPVLSVRRGRPATGTAPRATCATVRRQARYAAQYKRWCDEYFFLKHRDETRGVGGLFFDDLHGDFDAEFVYLRAGRRRLPRRLPADRRTPQGHAAGRARAPVPAVPARPLRRVQPGVRPRHAFRPAERRAAPSRS